MDTFRSEQTKPSVSVSLQALQFVLTVYLYRAFGRKDALKGSDPGDDQAYLDQASLDLAPED